LGDIPIVVMSGQIRIEVRLNHTLLAAVEADPIPTAVAVDPIPTAVERVNPIQIAVEQVNPIGEQPLPQCQQLPKQQRLRRNAFWPT
jgi:hypothetical protein